jgi:hypothetical protein
VSGYLGRETILLAPRDASSGEDIRGRPGEPSLTLAAAARSEGETSFHAAFLARSGLLVVDLTVVFPTRLILTIQFVWPSGAM